MRAFGTEDRHCEMRARIAIEMALNIEKYVDSTNLSKGTTKPGPMADKILNSYTMYSDAYESGKRLTLKYIRSILEKEVVTLAKCCSYMGICYFKHFKASSLLCVPPKGKPKCAE